MSVFSLIRILLLAAHYHLVGKCCYYFRLPAAERRGYTSVFNALGRIVSEEGVLTLWRGCGPTITRAMVVNAAQLASYSQAKQALFTTGEYSFSDKKI